MATTARFLVLWGQPDDPAGFEWHYREVHVPLALQIPGLRRYVLSRDITPVRGEHSYYLVAELDFDDLAALQAAFQSPQGQATAADVANLAQHATVASMTYQIEEMVK